tara:strand:+ start:114 stop:290 length:177 start_codon:yes stop_codon:yes gene_type:complete
MSESKGLGDSVERLAMRLKIKQLLDARKKRTGKDCGCSKRRDKLNKIFPYKNSKNENV